MLGLCYLFFSFLFISCKKDFPNKLNAVKVDSVAIRQKAINNKEDFEYLKKEILDNCHVKYVSLVDSTDFDNHKSYRILSDREQIFLGLDKTFSKGSEKYISKASIDYRLLLSQNFITIVVSYYLGEHELYTYFINYNKDFRIIDFKNIAYDEIAESSSKTKSEIWKDYITIINYNFTIEPPEIEESNFIIDSTGKIRKDMSL